ncbi:MAG: Gfo/Idh/MocA family oxidoreductase [Pirellulaceae bacterium]
MSTNQIAPALQKTERELVGIVTGTPAKEKIWQDKYGIEQKNIYNYDNFDKLVDNDDIDVVYIVLTACTKSSPYAVRRGKHVLCEKPMANSSARLPSDD